MEVAVEIGLVAMQAFAYKVGQGTYKGQVGSFEEQYTVFGSNTFFGNDLVGDCTEGRIWFGGNNLLD
jgi:hypothetical protein